MGRDETRRAWKKEERSFNPRAPCGARRAVRRSGVCRRAFQSTRPVWGATIDQGYRCRPGRCFNPRAPCGARRPHITRGGDDNAFQSTRPVWGATLRLPCWYLLLSVSIHAPRVGRDALQALKGGEKKCFNPRAPCGARPGNSSMSAWRQTFQSTRPVWGATAENCQLKRIIIVSIHAPRVGRD